MTRDGLQRADGLRSPKQSRVRSSLLTLTPVTLNVYADVIPDDDTSAVDAFSKVVWGA